MTPACSVKSHDLYRIPPSQQRGGESTLEAAQARTRIQEQNHRSCKARKGEEEQMSARPTGIETNGIGKRTTAHLNLTRSIAEVRKQKPEVAERSRVRQRARYALVRELARADGKMKFAGFDAEELQVQQFDWRRN